MFRALTWLAALTSGAAPEAEPLCVEITFLEQRPPHEQRPAPQPGFFVTVEEVPDAVAVETIATRVELRKQFSVQTSARERRCRIVGTVLKAHEGKFYLEVDAEITGPARSTTNRVHTSVELSRNEQMTIGGLTETSVSAVADGFFGLHTSCQETTIVRGCTIRLK
jgi:hypothetical protein